MLQTICPKCDTPLKGPDEYVGKSPRCPECKSRVPAPEAPAAVATAATPTELPKSHEDQLLDELLSEVDQKQKGKPSTQAARKATEPKHRPAAGKPAPVLQRKPRRSNLAGLITVAVVAVVIVVAGLVMLHYFNAKRIERELVRAKDQITRDVGEITGLMREADKKLEAKHYTEAESAYQAARVRAATVSSRLGTLLAGVDDAEVKEPVLDAQARVKSLLSQIDSKLKSDELVYGKKGLVLHEGEWMTPEQKMEKLGKTFRKEFNKYMTDTEYNEAKGLVLYRGEWLTPEQVEAIKKEEAARLAKREAELKAREEAERKKLEQLAAAKKAREKRLQELAAKRAEQYPPDAQRWVLDDFEDGKCLWKVETWSKPAAVLVIDQKGSKRLQVTNERGLQDKVAIGRPIALDLSSRDYIAMDYINLSQGVVKVALAIQSTEFFETRQKTARAGEGRLQFDLKAGDFKAESSNWHHNTRVQGLDAVRRIFLLIYTTRPGVFAIDNIVAEKAN